MQASITTSTDAHTTSNTPQFKLLDLKYEGGYKPFMQSDSPMSTKSYSRFTLFMGQTGGQQVPQDVFTRHGFGADGTTMPEAIQNAFDSASYAMCSRVGIDSFNVRLEFPEADRKGFQAFIKSVRQATGELLRFGSAADRNKVLVHVMYADTNTFQQTHQASFVVANPLPRHPDVRQTAEFMMGLFNRAFRQHPEFKHP